MHGISSLLKDGFLYAFTGMLTKASPIILLPILLRTLSQEEYGILALINSVIAIGSIIAGLGLRQYLTLEYFHSTQEQQKNLIWNIIVIYSFFAFIFLCGLTLATNKLFSFSVSPFCLTLISAIIIFSFFSELLYQLLQYQQKARLLSLLQIGFSALSFVTIYIALLCKQTITAPLLGQYFSIFAASCFFYWKWGYHEKIHKHSLPVFQESFTIVAKSVVFIPNQLLAWIISFANRWLIAHYCSLPDVALFAVADLSTQLFSIIVLYPWSAAYWPYIMKRFTCDNSKTVELMNRKIMMSTLIAGLFLITLGMVITKPILYWILPINYHNAIFYAWILLLGQLALLGSYFATCLIQYHKKTKFLAFAFFLPSGISLLLTYYLIQHHGILGCCMSISFSYLFYFFCTVCYNHTL